MLKYFGFFAKIVICEGLAGCVREQKSYQKNIKNDDKLHPKIDDKCMENAGQAGSQIEKEIEKRDLEINAEKNL